MTRGGGQGGAAGGNEGPVSRLSLLKTGAAGLASLGLWFAAGSSGGAGPEAAFAAPRVGSGETPCLFVVV